MGLMLMVLVLALCAPAGFAQCQVKVSGFLGTRNVFSPTFEGKIKEITWKKESNKVAEWSGQVVQYYGSFMSGRARLDSLSGSLTIQRAQDGDAGTYEVEILAEDGDSSSSGKIQRCRFDFSVTGPLLPPDLNCTVVGNKLHIFCHTDISKELTYSWHYSNMDELTGQSNTAELPLTADRSQKIYCIIEVSGAGINGSLSLDVCPEVNLIQPRGRNGFIALLFFVAVLIALIVTAIFLQKKGLLPSWISSRLPGGEGRHPEQQYTTEPETEPIHQIKNEQGGEGRHPEQQYTTEPETEPIHHIKNEQDSEAEDGKTLDKSEEDASGV
ncbi:CD48 antigen isoform X2 [Alligator mississippiensis]|uniref:CD48 antigen isoform X2 n=1 Tax=Alligator mississippiensis TaxID=8496 RepID=UPI002877F336|nr:CD48 antigen isoform X2 [Alligator mississippiensis]